jgi:uncharacterized protein YdhG (YjbR/CyaY superfamily)
MAKTNFKSVDEYIAAQPQASHAVLESVRGAIREALPRAEEVIAYNIPTYKLNGGAVIYFAGWKQHCSLYPAGARLLAAFKKDLLPYEINKSTIRLPLSEPVPVKLIGRIAKFRVKELAERKKAKPR